MIANVAIMAAAVRYGGLPGAAWASAGSYLILSVIYAFYTQRLWPIQFEFARVDAIFVLVVVAIGVLGELQDESLWAHLGIAAAVSAAYVASSFCIASLGNGGMMHLVRAKNAP